MVEQQIPAGKIREKKNKLNGRETIVGSIYQYLWKKERSKVKQTNKAKQHSTPKVVKAASGGTRTHDTIYMYMNSYMCYNIIVILTLHWPGPLPVLPW